jgi:hypothetical protein
MLDCLLIFCKSVELLLFFLCVNVFQLQRNMDHQGKELGQMDNQEVSNTLYFSMFYKSSVTSLMLQRWKKLLLHARRLGATIQALVAESSHQVTSLSLGDLT